MKLQKTIIFLVLLVYGCSTRQKEEGLLQEKTRGEDRQSFFVSAPIAQFNPFQCPSVYAEIEGKTYLLKLDLGFRGDVAIQRDVIHKIVSKTYMSEYSTMEYAANSIKRNSIKSPS